MHLVSNAFGFQCIWFAPTLDTITTAFFCNSRLNSADPFHSEQDMPRTFISITYISTRYGLHAVSTQHSLWQNIQNMALKKDLRQVTIRNFLYCFFLTFRQICLSYPASVISVTLAQPAFLEYMGLVNA